MPVRTLLSIISAAALAASCAPTIGGRTPAPFPGAIAGPARSPAAVTSPPAPLDRARLVQTALALQGTPYQAGGDSPGTGFDCSGFVHFLFREQGWELPRTVREQFAYGRKIREREIQSGDLLFFATESRGATHVGLAVDPADAPALRSGHPFIHAPGDNGAVRFDALESAYWKPRFLGARRLF